MGVGENNIFNRIVCINLDRRQDRWQSFQSGLAECRFPFQSPDRFSAVDGWKLPVPDGWGGGMHGAYGAMLSHRGVLQQAIIDGIADDPAGKILVMEDDCFFRPSFAEEFNAFYQALPSDWQFLFLGSQANHNTSKVNEHVKKVRWANRFHCYAVRGELIRELYQKLCSSSGHCDLVIHPWLGTKKVYCPVIPLACQESGWSDISSSNEVRRWWADATGNEPAVYLRCPRDVAEDLYSRGLLHPGYNRNAEGVDCWLAGLVKEHGTTGGAITNTVRNFVHGLRGEALGEGSAMLACLWCPELPPETCRSAIGKSIIEIEAGTVDEALTKLGSR